MIDPATLGPDLYVASSQESCTSDGTLEIGFVGDVYLQTCPPLSPDLPDFAAIGKRLWAPFSKSGLIVANLEAPITEQQAPLQEKAYLHKSPAAVLEAFDERCFLSLANNHIMDYGTSGLQDTLRALNDSNISHAGAGMNLDEARRPEILDIAGVRIGILCAADPRFNAASSNEPGTCPADKDILAPAITALRATTDMVIVSIHMGLEHVAMPSVRQISLAQACLNAGAGVVQFHHAHRLGGVATTANGVVLFGTGNYAYMKKSSPLRPWTRRTASWHLLIDPHRGTVTQTLAAPARLDSTGIPVPLSGTGADRLVKLLKRNSRWSAQGRLRAAMRLLECFHPGFILANARNYAVLLRKRGPAYVFQQILGGFRAQVGG